MTKLEPVSEQTISRITGGGVWSYVTGAPSRYLNGYAYGRRIVGPAWDMSPGMARYEGFLGGAVSVFDPSTPYNVRGAELRAREAALET